VSSYFTVGNSTVSSAIGGSVGIGVAAPAYAYPNNQFWARAETSRFGRNADAGNHDNAIIGVGSNDLTKADIVGWGVTNPGPNTWGIWSFPVIDVTAGVSGSIHSHGIAAGSFNKSDTGSARNVPFQIGLRVLNGQTDGVASVTGGYGIWIDSITANAGTGTSGIGFNPGFGIYNNSNYTAPNADTYIRLGVGATGYDIQGHVITIGNGAGIYSGVFGGATYYRLLGTDSSDTFYVGAQNMNSIFLDNKFIYLGGNGAGQGTYSYGSLVVPYGVSAGTGTFSGAVNVSGALTTSNGNGGVYTNSSPTWSVLNAAGTTGIVYGGTTITPYSSSVAGTAMTFNGGAGGNIGVGTTVTQSTFNVNGSFNFGAGATKSTGSVSGDLLLAGTLGVAGASTLSGTLGVTGATTLNSTLVTGANLSRAADGLVDLGVGVYKKNTSGQTFYIMKSTDATNYSALAMSFYGHATDSSRVWQMQTIDQGLANAGKIEMQPSGGTIGLQTTVSAGTQLFYCSGGTFDGNICRGASCICTGGTATALGVYVK
jgi:hypothetical protein